MNTEKLFIRHFPSYPQFIQKMWKTGKRNGKGFLKTLKKVSLLLKFSLTFALKSFSQMNIQGNGELSCQVGVCVSFTGRNVAVIFVVL